MSSALETLCGQAYGAKQYRQLGTYLQRGWIVLNVSCIPIAFIWMNIHTLLRAMGQDPEIADYAGLYTRWMIPSLFANAFLLPIVKFLQTQSAVIPMACCSALTLSMHIPICWLFVYKLGVGYQGAAMANAVSSCLNVTFLAIYVKFGPTCKRTWVGFTSEAFHEMPAFFKLAIPSAAMIWWVHDSHASYSSPLSDIRHCKKCDVNDVFILSSTVFSACFCGILRLS